MDELEVYLSAKNVGPEAREKLKGLLKYYASKPHPFRACVRDNRKRFGPGTERVCATIKDMIRGTTKWRGNEKKDKGSEGISNLSESLELALDTEEYDEDLVAALAKLTDDELETLFNIAKKINKDEEEDSDGEDDYRDTELAEANYRIGSPVEGSCGECTHFQSSRCTLHVGDVKEYGLCDDFSDSHILVDTTSSTSLSEDNIEAFCLSSTIDKETGTEEPTVWKTVLKTGQWKVSPGSSGTSTSNPMTVVKNSGLTDSRSKTISLEDIVDSFKKKPIQHVTVPLEHTQDPDKNTGYVEDLEIVDSETGSELRAKIKFTEKSVYEKVKNRSIADTSVGLKFGYVRKTDGVKFPIALDHVALTNKPWIDGLKPFSLSENSATKRVSYELQEVQEMPDPVKEKDGGKAAEGTEDVSVQLSQLENELQKLREEKEELHASNLLLAEEAKKRAVESRITELSETHLGDMPGLLSKAKEYMLQDAGDSVVELSDSGQSSSKTVTEVVEDLLSLIPAEDLKLSQQGSKTDGEKKPPTGTEGELPIEERVAQAKEFLGL